MTDFAIHHSKHVFASKNHPQISKHVFIRTPRRHYHELEIFKQQVESNQQGLHHQPYTVNKSSVKLYKMIFFSFACIFAMLSFGVIATDSAITYSFFNFSIILKTFITLICCLFSLTSFMIAITMRTEREAIVHYAHAAKRAAAKLYARKKVAVGIKRFLTFIGYPQQQAHALKSLYHEVCDKIQERKEEVLHLVNRVQDERTLSAHTKEILYNQAIAEFNDKLTLLVHNFKHSHV